MTFINYIKKAGILFTVSLGVITVSAQEKGSYFTGSATLGSSSIKYDLENGSRKSGFGYGVQAGYSYYFNPNWGIATGVGITHYQSKGTFGSLTNENYFNLGNQVDDDDISGETRNYELRARLGNWKEKQTTFVLDIPIMGVYQTRFGDDKQWGFYGGLGVKLQIPVNTKFKIENNGGQMNVSGYYKDILIDMGAPGNPPVSQHGFGTIDNANSVLTQEGSSKLKIGIAGTVEAGLLFDLQNDMDLLLGGFLDYGFSDIKKSNQKGLITAPDQYLPGANNQIGKGIGYNYMLNSDVTGKVNLISFGVKVGLRFKL